jgi:hypothetical protein
MIQFVKKTSDQNAIFGISSHQTTLLVHKRPICFRKEANKTLHELNLLLATHLLPNETASRMIKCCDE